jgi:hypothetical protein
VLLDDAEVVGPAGIVAVLLTPPHEILNDHAPGSKDRRDTRGRFRADLKLLDRLEICVWQPGRSTESQVRSIFVDHENGREAVDAGLFLRSAHEYVEDRLKRRTADGALQCIFLAGYEELEL